MKGEKQILVIKSELRQKLLEELKTMQYIIAETQTKLFELNIRQKNIMILLEGEW